MGLFTCTEVLPLSSFILLWETDSKAEHLQSVGPFSRAKPQVFGLELRCAESMRTLIASLLPLWKSTHSKNPACVILLCGKKLHISFLLLLVVVGAEPPQHTLKVPLGRCPFPRFVPPIWQKLRS